MVQTIVSRPGIISQLKTLKPVVDGNLIGMVASVKRLLGASSTLSLVRGTSNPNFKMSNGDIYTTIGIGDKTQTAIVRESLGQVALEYAVDIKGTVVAVLPSLVSLIPNPAPAPNFIAGPIDHLGVSDAGSPINFIEGTLTSPGDMHYFVAGLADGSSKFGYYPISTNRLIGQWRNADGSYTPNASPGYDLVPAGSEYEPTPTTFRIEITQDLVLKYTCNGILVHARDVSEPYHNGELGNYVVIDAGYGARFENVSYGATGASAVPLKVRSQNFVNGFTPSAVLEYTGSPYTYKVQIEKSNGDIVIPFENVFFDSYVKGVVTVRGVTSIPNPSAYVGDVLIIRWGEFDSSGNKVRDITKSITLPDRIPQFGWSLTDMNNSTTTYRTFANIAASGSWFNSTNYQPTGDIDGNPSAVGNARFIGHGPTSGIYSSAGVNTLRATWDQDSGVDAVWEAVSLVGSTAYGAITVSGPRQIDFVETFDFSAGSADYLMGVTYGALKLKSAPSGGLPKNLKIYPVGEDRETLFSKDYVDHQRSVKGPLHFAKARYVLGNGNNNITWADRTPPSRLLNWGVDGIPIEYIIALSVLTGRDVYFNVPGWASDDYYTRCFKALNTGEGLEAGKIWSNGVPAGRKIYVEWSSDVSSISLPNYNLAINKYCSRTNTDAPSDGTVGAEYAQREHVFQHNHVMTLLEQAIGNYSTRCVRVISSPRGTSYYQGLKDKGVSRYDALNQQAYIYLDTSYIQTTNKSPSQLKVALSSLCDSTLDGFLPIYQLVKQDGKRLIATEAGVIFDLYSDGAITYSQIKTFKTSQEFYDCMNAFYNKWATTFSDVLIESSDIASNSSLVDVRGSNKSRGLQAMLTVQTLFQ